MEADCGEMAEADTDDSGRGNFRREGRLTLVQYAAPRVGQSAETWPSGRRHTPAKGAYRKRYRGFESLRLRHLPSRRRSPDPAVAGFSRCFRGLCGGLLTGQGAKRPESLSQGRHSLKRIT